MTTPRNVKNQLPNPEDLFDFDDNIEEIQGYMPHSSSALKLQIVGREADLFHQEDWNDDFDDAVAINIAKSLQGKGKGGGSSPSPTPSTPSVQSKSTPSLNAATCVVANKTQNSTQQPPKFDSKQQPTPPQQQSQITNSPKKAPAPVQQPRPDSTDSLNWDDSDDDVPTSKQQQQPQKSHFAQAVAPPTQTTQPKRTSVSLKKSHSRPLSGDDSPWDDDDDDDVVVIPKKKAAPEIEKAQNQLSNASATATTNPVIAPHVKAQLKNPELRGDEGSDWSLDSEGDWDEQLDGDSDAETLQTRAPDGGKAKSSGVDPTKGARALGKYVDDDDDDYDDEGPKTKAQSAGKGDSSIGGSTSHPHANSPGQITGANSSGYFSWYNRTKPVKYLKHEHRLVSALDASSLQSGVDIIMYPAPPTLFTMLTLDGFRGITEIQVIAFLSNFGLRLNNLLHPLSLSLMNGQPSTPHTPLKTHQFQNILENQAPWLLPDSTVTRCIPLVTYLYYCYQYSFLSYRARQYQQTWDIFSTVMAYLGITVEGREPRTKAILNDPIAFRIVYQLAFLASKLWAQGTTSEPYRWYIAFLACIIFPKYAPLLYILEINTIAHHTGQYSNQVLNVLCQIYETQHKLIADIPPVPLNHMGLPTNLHPIQHNLTQFTNFDQHIDFYTGVTAPTQTNSVAPTPTLGSSSLGPPTPLFGKMQSLGYGSGQRLSSSGTNINNSSNNTSTGNTFATTKSIPSASSTPPFFHQALPPFNSGTVRPQTAVPFNQPPLLGDTEVINPKAIALEACLQAITSIELYLTGYSPLNGTPLNDLNEFDREHDQYRWLQFTSAMSLDEYRRSHQQTQTLNHIEDNRPPGLDGFGVEQVEGYNGQIVQHDNDDDDDDDDDEEEEHYQQSAQSQGHQNLIQNKDPNGLNSWYIMNSSNAWNLIGHGNYRIGELYKLYLQHHEWTWVKAHSALCLARHHLHIGSESDQQQQQPSQHQHPGQSNANSNSSSSNGANGLNGRSSNVDLTRNLTHLTGLGSEVHTMISEKMVMETLYVLDNIPHTPSYDYLFELCNNQTAVYTQKISGSPNPPLLNTLSSSAGSGGVDGGSGRFAPRESLMGSSPHAIVPRRAELKNLDLLPHHLALVALNSPVLDFQVHFPLHPYYWMTMMKYASLGYYLKVQ